MSAHRARHRAPAGSPPAAAGGTALELLERLGHSDSGTGRAARRHLTDGPSVATVPVRAVDTRRSRHRADTGTDGSLPSPRSAFAKGSTLTMLAVTAVGAGTAMTGTFAAVPADDVAPMPTALAGQPVVMDDVLVPASSAGPARSSGSAQFIAAAAAALPAALPTTAADAPTTAMPGLAQQLVDMPASATVLAEDTHKTNAREIAALARSVNLERGKKTGALGLPTPAALDLAPGAAMRATAMNAALGKIGVPYVWGAAGPKAFDCSGLVLWSFKKVGISLPHSSKAQSKMGKAVAKKDLRPGDLVFFYTPVSHVGIFIGNGKVVHASEPGKPVKISDVNRMPFHNARRL